MTREGTGASKGKTAGSILALALVTGCGRQPPLPPVGSVVVRATELAPALEEAGLDSSRTIEVAKAALVASGFAIDLGAQRSHGATFEVVAFSVLGPGAGGASQAEVVVTLELTPSWASDQVERRSGRSVAPLSGPDPRDAWRRALDGAASEAARAVMLDLRAQRKGTEGLESDLSDADPRVRERALRTLMARGARTAVRGVAGRVHDPDPEVARAAVDALVAFKDPTTVLSLIEAAQAGSVTTTIRIIPVLAEIGGADVEGYLLTLQAGHGDRAVRQAAADALAQQGRNAAKMRRP